MVVSTLFHKLPSVNDVSGYIVRFSSGPILTMLVNQNHEKVSLIFANSIIPHLFLTCISPFTIEKFFMSQHNTWQAHVVGMTTGWVATYLFVKNFGFTKLPDPTGQNQEQERKKTAKDVLEITFSNWSNPGKALVETLSYLFKPSAGNIAIRSTIMPCLVSTLLQLYRLYKL